MRRREWTVLPAAVVLALVLGSAACSLDGGPVAASGGSRIVTPPEARSAAPPLTGTTATGTTLDLAALHGTVVVVNFWPSWCLPCGEEMPLLVKLAGSYPQVAFLGVNVRDSANAARRFEQSLGVPYPSIPDPQGALSARWPTTHAIPTTFVVDPRGQIATRFIGGFTSKDLTTALNQLATEKN